ncbi:MAG TPA: RDD family protein [Pilimelia sp.]|nr:RDD family protein [Pilimelia sp.]
MSVAPGWYPDPADRTTQRYWDGEGWLGDPLPVDAPPPPGPPAGLPGAAPPPYPGAPAAPPPYPGATPVAPPYRGATAGAPPYPVTGPGAPHPGAPTPYPPVPGAYPPHAVGRPAGAVPGPHPGGYGPPPAALVHGHAVASLGARIVARVIDIAVVAALCLVVNGWFLWQIVELAGPPFRDSLAAAQAGRTEPMQVPREVSMYLMLAVVVSTALWAAYEIPALANNGQTLGKRLTHIQVVRLEEPGPLGVRRALLRWNPIGMATMLWFCWCIGLLLQVVSCAAALFDRPLRQALHDRAAMTAVVAVPSPSHRPGGSAGPHPPSGTGGSAGPHPSGGNR